jgi:hypothetical protein
MILKSFVKWAGLNIDSVGLYPEATEEVVGRAHTITLAEISLDGIAPKFINIQSENGRLNIKGLDTSDVNDIKRINTTILLPQIQPSHLILKYRSGQLIVQAKV